MTRLLPALLCVVLLGGSAMGAKALGWRWRLPHEIAAPPVPIDNPMTEAKVALGRRLFYDADLSIDGTMSCGTCHEQRRAFADGNRTHAGVHGEPGRRNVPGLANVAWQPMLTWADPRVRTLESQVAIPVLGLSPLEMGMHGQEREIAARLGKDACYPKMFRMAFPETGGAIDMANIARALASFERSLISYRSPYDIDQGALSAAARNGMAVFNSAGCASCHSGGNFSDGAFHAIKKPSGTDHGLAEVTSRPEDIGSFRTPGLRNAALTAPYLHDGSADTLAAAIRRHQTGSALPDRDIGALIAFIETLTDRHFITDKHHARPDHACGQTS